MNKKLGVEEGVKRLLSGNYKLVLKKHLIDLNANPFVPTGCEVEEHQRTSYNSGLLKWDAAKIELYTDPSQQNGYIAGSELRKKLAGKPVLNANVLDFLLDNPQLIPKSWKKDKRGIPRPIFFWGTIYHKLVDNPDAIDDGVRYRVKLGAPIDALEEHHHFKKIYLVRSMYWADGGWHWSTLWLFHDCQGPAALRAS